MMGRYLLGIDVGGTFTDFVAWDRSTNQLTAWKNLSHPEDPTAGILEGLRQLEALADVDIMRLGTTVATNAILERKGAEVAYVTTQGFRDIPFLQRGNRAHHYDSSWVKPKPLVRRRHCFEVDERVLSTGEVMQPLSDTAIQALGTQIRDVGDIEAIAINLLFSYLSPAHERQLRDGLSAMLGDIPISLSSEVLPKWKEYERASTVLADAYVKPVVLRYLSDMEGRFAAAGIRGTAVVMKSNGGEMSLEAAGRQPVHMTLSGPSGGVVAAAEIAARTGDANIVTLDMGGTSTDCSPLVRGQMAFTTDFEIEFGVPIQIPMIDIRTIGAGGGSIAWVDRGGMLRVGPQSAGASPGPACYGFGGEAATVTDANVVLGRLNAAGFLGGGMQLDAAAAERAVRAIAARIDMDLEQAALAILRIVNNNMVGALRTVLIERGLDPRDFALLAFGGAGPLHVGELMLEAGIPRGIVPLFPGQFSALGFAFADARIDLEQTVQMTSAHLDFTRSTELLQRLVEKARQDLAAQGYADPARIELVLEMRYLGQNYALDVPYEREAFDEDGAAQLWARFHTLHEARFGFAIPQEVIEVITLKCRAVVATAKPELARLEPGREAPSSTRPVWFEQGRLDARVLNRADLGPGAVIAGPALIEEAASTTVVAPGQRVTVHDEGHLIINAIADEEGSEA